MLEIYRFTSTLHTLLEILVEEEKVEKREFIIDKADHSTVNDREYREVVEKMDEDNLEETKIFYRASSE